jgi:hypothetical protein
MKPRNVPRGARHLRYYKEFDSYLIDFVLGRYPFLWIVGRPGVLKTESMNRAIGGRNVYLCKAGQLTPLQFYIDCYRYRGHPVILDDAEHLLDNKIGARLVSALGDTGGEKVLSYRSTTRALGDVPQSYSTTSPLCIIANRGTTHEANQSRAVIVYFDPTNPEVHREVGNFFWDQEIHDWFGQHVTRLSEFDARWYVTAYHDKQAGRDWRRIILEAYSLSKASALVQDLEADPAYSSSEAKVARFQAVLQKDPGASRATYYRLRRKLKERGQLVYHAEPPIPLRRTRPPRELSPAENDLARPGTVEELQTDTTPVDVPRREGFAEPIRGSSQQQPVPRRGLDDTLPGEPPEPEVEDDDDPE